MNRRANFIKLVKAFQYGHSCETAAAICGMKGDTVRHYVIEMRRLGVSMRIIDWEKDSTGRHSRAVYQLGEGEDVAKPAPMTQKQRTTRAAYRARLRRISKAPASVWAYAAIQSKAFNE